MKKLVYILFCALFFSCSVSDKKNSDIKLFLNVSYDNTEIFTIIDQANQLIRKKHLDSIANSSSGIELLDVLNKKQAEEFSSQSKSIEDYPLYQVFNPFTSLNKNGNIFIDSSALVGFTDDTTKFLDLVNKVKELFPKDMYWQFEEESIIGYKGVYALKANKELILSKKDIDSVIVSSKGLNEVGGIVGKYAEAKGMTSYNTSIKLNNEVFEELENGTYRFCILINSKSYFGSVIKNINRQNKLIEIGVLKKEEVEILRKEFNFKSRN
ncbi:MAG: hypothetical protein HPY60_10760 [Candidatus Methanofastidiosum sp.]|nr:hypothetical protein [Methanofastidiosum sp.]